DFVFNYYFKKTIWFYKMNKPKHIALHIIYIYIYIYIYTRSIYSREFFFVTFSTKKKIYCVK
ncbi:hypothetical protein ACMBCM_09080, partial [Spiroplasma sp. K1]